MGLRRVSILYKLCLVIITIFSVATSDQRYIYISYVVRSLGRQDKDVLLLHSIRMK